MTDPHAVVTSDNLTSLRAVLAKAEKSSLATIKVRGGTTPYFAKVHTELVEREDALKERITKMEDQVGRMSRKDPAVANLIKAVTEWAKVADVEAKRQPATVYVYGKTVVPNSKALEQKVKGSLSANDASCVTKTVGKAVKGDAKDASKFGAGMRHASSGDGTKSCTIFFTRESRKGGLEDVVTIHAVGGHEGSSSYRITESFVSTLPKGKVATL